MCGIAGILDLSGQQIPGLERRLAVMGNLIAHRGPDGKGQWQNKQNSVGLAHRRLSIIDRSDNAAQPMIGENGSVISFNGEIYNYKELRQIYQGHWPFHSSSDTETILAAYAAKGVDCLEDLRGMFAFALWDGEQLFCARDRFGIKPFYYTQIKGRFIFASEAKALLPFLEEIETDETAFAEYLTFQFAIGEHTLFKGIKQLLPGNALIVRNGQIKVWRYWDVHYDIDWDHTPRYFSEKLDHLLDDSLNYHLRSDVEVGAYLSGGMDSSLISILSAQKGVRHTFHGKFLESPAYDESEFARIAAAKGGFNVDETTITSQDFIDNFEKVIWHLDFPVAGPGAFPQYMVSKSAAQKVKVVLGGQGGDEIFGGYARYLIAYFEQCIKAAINGTQHNGNFVVTPESIIPNLGVLREYVPLLKKFWAQGLFGPLDERYFRLIDRSADMDKEVDWTGLSKGKVFEDFRSIFNSEKNVRKEAYFDSMTHFDFKTLLPALLHVEDRMSMAHGLEARVPFLDHALVEFVATVPADVKFKDGNAKQFLKVTFGDILPDQITHRRDKMGFPVPLNEWFKGDLKEYVYDIFSSDRAKTRPHINADEVLKSIFTADGFSRKVWGLLCLETWYRTFADRAHEFKAMID